MLAPTDRQLEVLCWDPHEEEREAGVPRYAADFETTTKADDCRVWAWGVCEVGDDCNVQTGNDIEGFLRWCRHHCGSKVYFHNLKFDGKFILSHLMNDGWEWVPDPKEAGAETITTLISDMGMFYSIRIHFTDEESVEFLDSLKVIPLPVAKIPKAFGLSMDKLELDYHGEREPGHVLTPEEREYLLHDVRIVSQALEIMLDEGMTRMTAGSNAFAGYQRGIGGKRRFRDWFPEPSYDALLREGGCYKGGFTAVNPRFRGVEVGEGVSFDVNSLYPSVMACVHGEVLPWGEPERFDGRFEPTDEFPVCIQVLKADFSVKEGRIPSLQMKGNSLFSETEYVRDSAGMQPLCLTSVDLELMFEQYDVHEVEWLGGWRFNGSSELFTAYVDEWTEVKTRATEEGNEGMRTIAKLMLNSLYGKFATNPVKQSKRPYLEDGVVKYALLPKECKEAVYLPVGAFVTAYARAFTVRAAQRNFHRWLYSDTDSNYFLGTEPPDGMEVHPTKLGAWKEEHRFSRFKALRAKTYVFEEAGDVTVHCAGMPSRCHASVTFDNFDYGSSFEGKLMPKDVKGGTILVEDRFTIKPDKEVRK